MEKRGLVVSPPIVQEGSTIDIISPDLDPQELRWSLLFWDKLNFPVNNIVEIETSDEALYLQQAGVLDRQQVRAPFSGDLATLFVQAHVAAFRQLDQAEPGTWSLATGPRSISFSDADLVEGRGALVKLHQAIPVPDKDVPLNDILEFRERRRAELLALRHHLEWLYQKIGAASDGDLAINTEIESLQEAIVDHIRVIREPGWKLRLSDVSASLNLRGALGGTLAALALGLPAVQSVLAGAAAGINVTAGAALKRREVNETPFKYVSSYNAEVF